MSLTLSDRSLARRYARAFYARVGREGAAQAAGELAAAARTLAGTAGTLRHPRVTLEAKKRLLRESLQGSVSEGTLRFLELLVDKKRFELLAAVAEDFARLCDEERGILHACARSAAALDPGQTEALKARLKRFFGKEIALEVRVDPELIGGAVVRAGDWVFDASLQGELSRLRERLAG